MERTTPVLYLVVPCYNEEEVIEKSAQVLGDKLRRLAQAGKIGEDSKVMFVNDGWSVLQAIMAIRALSWPA